MPKYTSQKEMVPPMKFGWETPYGQLGMSPNDPGWGNYDISVAQMGFDRMFGTGGDYESFNTGNMTPEMAPDVAVPSPYNPGVLQRHWNDPGAFTGKTGM